jgi:predicted MFS family arabinose efflux permease
MVAIMSGAFIAIQTLWAGRWLSDVAGVDRASVADVLLFMAIGFVIGSLTTGWIADRAQRHRLTIELVVGCSFLIFAIGQFLVVLHAPVPPVLPWILFGFAGQAGNLGYATLAAHFGSGAAGRAQTTANLLLFGSAWALQWGIGAVLELVSRGRRRQRRSSRLLLGLRHCPGPPDAGGPLVFAPEPGGLTCGMTVTLPFRVN